MSEPTNYQREKATEVVQVCLTPTVAERVREAANTTFNGNVSGWAKQQLAEAAQRVVEKYKQRTCN
jgi:hypothetical protein